MTSVDQSLITHPFTLPVLYRAHPPRPQCGRPPCPELSLHCSHRANNQRVTWNVNCRNSKTSPDQSRPEASVYIGHLTRPPQILHLSPTISVRVPATCRNSGFPRTNFVRGLRVLVNKPAFVSTSRQPARSGDRPPYSDDMALPVCPPGSRQPRRPTIGLQRVVGRDIGRDQHQRPKPSTWSRAHSACGIGATELGAFVPQGNRLHSPCPAHGRRPT
jgi:hypothetical protein